MIGSVIIKIPTTFRNNTDCFGVNIMNLKAAYPEVPTWSFLVRTDGDYYRLAVDGEQKEFSDFVMVPCE